MTSQRQKKGAFALSTTCKLSELVSPAFIESHRAVKSGCITELIEKGGRGSGKSSYISIELVLLLLQHPQCHAVVLRQVARTLRTSVYAQVVWAITTLGLYPYFKMTVSPMEIVYKPTGQKIMFFGLDDPGKLKSLKVPNGYIGICWFEELDQYSEAEIRNVEQSVFRGGDFSFCFKSFNPPRSRAVWVNRIQQADKVFIHHTTYLTTPREWLGDKFIDDAERLKEVNEQAYLHEYLGEAVGDGGNVFNNIEAREITDEEIAGFDRIYQGLDFGWYPDPLAFIRLHYDKARDTIYFLDELYVNKWSNRRTAEELIKRSYGDTYITCDSAEPKSVEDLRGEGLPARKAAKGPGSVEYGMKWLAGRKLVIDPQRTPHALKEFTEYELERDKDDNFISAYPDRNNHLIDATRYALERVYAKKYNPA